MQFRIRQVERQADTPEISRQMEPVNLSETEVNAILRRLPPMPIEDSDRSEFQMRSNSLLPPKTGNIISTKFSAAENQNSPNVRISNSITPKVVRFSPSGDVPLVTDLSVTFSQPMISVGSRQKQVKDNVPVNLVPNVKGNWRWLGTKTLVFDAESRFPMATKFTATIPAGTKSAAGVNMPKEVSWTFSTAPPKIEKFIPSDKTVKRDAIILAVFNQEINAEAVLQKTTAFAFNRVISLRLANQEEIAADEEIQKTTRNLSPNRWIAFRAVKPLPPNAMVVVNFNAGTPSAEGDLTTTESQYHQFKTFGTLKFEQSYCAYSENLDDCRAYGDWRIKFNNPLDDETIDKSKIKIEPNIETAEISVSGDSIKISGTKETRRNYTVTVSGSIKDVFGQSLGKDVSTKFKIGAEESALYSQGNDLVTLDPNGKPLFSVYSTNYQNLNVKLYAVQAEDYGAFYAFKKTDKGNIPAIGRLVYEKSLKIKSSPDAQTETKINISPALTKNYGHAILIVESPGKDATPIVKWLQMTNIGIDAFADYEKLTVFASNLKNGRPLPGAQVSLSNGATGVTVDNGLVSIVLPKIYEDKGDWLIAAHQSDTAILLENDYYNGDKNWSNTPADDTIRWFVINDRNMYRPGETISVKGYIRRITGGKTSDVAELADAVSNLTYVLRDSRKNEITKGAAKLNAFGAFDLKLSLPENINLGNQYLELKTESTLENKTFTHNFQVQEFRRPEFEVQTNVEDAAPFYIGDSATIGTQAKYYSGGFLAKAETVWNVTASVTSYVPPNQGDYTFGKFVPWWRYSPDESETTSQQIKGTTGADGKHQIALDFTSANPARPYTIKAEAKIQDVNRQTFASSTDLLVHPSELYVGIRTPKNFVRAGEKFKIELIATDINGKAVAGAPVSIKAELKDWQKVKGAWEQVTIDAQNCQIRSGSSPVSCEISAKQGGTYTITADVYDSRNRRNESELPVWVAGGKTEPARDVEQEEAVLIPDKKEYSPDETAEILVNSPFVSAEGVLTLRRNGIVKAERFTMQESSTVLRIPIEESYLPNIHVQVDLVGTAPRIVYDDERDAKLPQRPAFASGELNLDVSTEARRLIVTAEPLAKTLEPGGETKINVAVKDFQGNAVANSEVAVIAVDESVIALTNYKIADPLAVFYQKLDKETADYHSRESILLSYPGDIGFGFGFGSGNGNGSGTPGGFGERTSVFRPMETIATLKRPPSVGIDSANQIRLRSNFDALALFSPSVKTDANGNAVVNVKLPDNLTRYRVTAVAVTDSKQFGSIESNITARQSLMVRPSPPRFMNFGDRIDLPIVLQNQTGSAMTIDLAIRATNANLTAGRGRKITIAAGDRAEIRFPVSAGKAGTARFQVGAVSGKYADAAEFELPVYTPATGETLATYGTTDQIGAIAQPISAPMDVYSEYGGLEITTSSTQLQELTDAFIYLQNYPFECSEQISSRVLSVAALRDVLTAFDAKDLPSKNEIEAKMKSDIERLAKLQHRDGGFSFWRSDDESFPYVSVHVAHALARARAKNYQVPPDTIGKSLVYLKNIELKYPDYYSQESRWAISAYALSVRALFGDKDFGKAQRLLQEATLEKLSLESIGWILSVLADDETAGNQLESIKQNLSNRATETAGAAHFVTSYKDGEYVLLASDRRADGVVLESLLQTDPQNDLIPKIVRGLLAGKTKGRWSNTQENAFILLALDRYFKTYERVTPDFVTRVWLGNAYAGEQKFVGRAIDSRLINVPMDYLHQQPGSNLVLDKQGTGRLYYRIGLNYAPKNLKLDAADEGFVVTRSYEAIDAADDVRQTGDGNWTIKSGSRIRVKIQMVAPTRRYHVALVDRLPAGFEIINPDMANSETLLGERDNAPANNSGYYIQNRRWFDHQNMRDDRAEAFTTLLREGVWSYSFVVRATTPGFFIVPPAKAEEMYHPETFGRTETAFVRVE